MNEDRAPDPFQVIKMQITGELRSSRRNAFNDTFDNITVDTCNSPDSGWETGVARDGGEWIIVEYYDGKEPARIGHAKWVKLLKENRDAELKSVQSLPWGLTKEDLE